MERNQYSYCLIDPTFQGLNRLFVLSFQDDAQKVSNKRYFLLIEEIKKYNDWWKKFFGQPVKDNLITHEKIRKIAPGQGDDYTTGCLLDYSYLKKIIKLLL